MHDTRAFDNAMANRRGQCLSRPRAFRLEQRILLRAPLGMPNMSHARVRTQDTAAPCTRNELGTAENGGADHN